MPYLRKTLPFIALASLATSGLEASDLDAAAVYKKISTLLKEGDVEGAHALMTDKESAESIGGEMLNLALEVFEKNPIPDTLEDGSKVDVSPSDLGFDTWNPPAWMKPGKMGAPTEDWEILQNNLLKQFNALPNRKAALRSLDLLSRSFGSESMFGAKIVAPREGFKPRADRLWIGSSETPDIAMPLLFEKDGNSWKFAGIDWETDGEVAERWKFEEKEDHPIKGKGAHGEIVSLENLQGKIVLIDFWGTW